MSTAVVSLVCKSKAARFFPKSSFFFKSDLDLVLVCVCVFFSVLQSIFSFSLIDSFLCICDWFVKVSVSRDETKIVSLCFADQNEHNNSIDNVGRL